MLTNLELLRIRSEDSLDRRGRVAGWYGLTIACAPEGQELWIGADVPDALAAELTSVFDGTAPATAPAEPPPALEPCRRLLETGGRPVKHKAGPSYVFPETTDLEAEILILRSDGGNYALLQSANPGNWHPVEWDELLAGLLGPWTMAIHAELVVSICHTPGPFSARGAEAGVWTHLDFRRRGYGAAVTAEWAAMMRSPGRHLFYSTDGDNLPSQGVARRLGLRPLGWTWALAPATDQEDRLHPLCSLRQRR